MCLPSSCTHSYYARLSGAGSFTKYYAVLWNFCRPSYQYVYTGYIQGRGTDLMYTLGRVPTDIWDTGKRGELRVHFHGKYVNHGGVGCVQGGPSHTTIPPHQGGQRQTQRCTRGGLVTTPHPPSPITRVDTDSGGGVARGVLVKIPTSPPRQTETAGSRSELSVRPVWTRIVGYRGKRWNIMGGRDRVEKEGLINKTKNYLVWTQTNFIRVRRKYS